MIKKASHLLVFLAATSFGCDLESRSVGDGGETGTTVPQTPEEFWSALIHNECDYLEDCECSNPNGFYENVDACLGERQMMYTPDRNNIVEHNLSFDPSCGELFLHNAGVPECGTTSNAELLAQLDEYLFANCVPFRGTKSEGESCDPFFNSWSFGTFAEECAEGLTCSTTTQTCRPEHVRAAPEAVGAGETCVFVEQDVDGEELHYAADCPTGYFCLFEPDGACVPISNETGPCNTAIGGPPNCDDESYCNTETLTCWPRLDVGDACDHGGQCKTRHCDQQTGVCGTDYPVCH